MDVATAAKLASWGYWSWGTYRTFSTARDAYYVVSGVCRVGAFTARKTGDAVRWVVGGSPPEVNVQVISNKDPIVDSALFPKDAWILVDDDGEGIPVGTENGIEMTSNQPN
jgi:hypothetical protein